jgi:hypothetical protein
MCKKSLLRSYWPICVKCALKQQRLHARFVQVGAGSACTAALHTSSMSFCMCWNSACTYRVARSRHPCRRFWPKLQSHHLHQFFRTPTRSAQPRQNAPHELHENACRVQGPEGSHFPLSTLVLLLRKLQTSSSRLLVVSCPNNSRWRLSQKTSISPLWA